MQKCPSSFGGFAKLGNKFQQKSGRGARSTKTRIETRIRPFRPRSTVRKAEERDPPKQGLKLWLEYDPTSQFKVPRSEIHQNKD